jgi:hypothetical protein
VTFVDLHVHTTASDGEFTPAEVVGRAAEVGLAAIALTDHDTLGGVPEAEAAGERLGVRVVAGCEFSASAPWGELHLLGYFLSPDDDALLEFLQQQQDGRAARADHIVERLRGLGVPLESRAVRFHAGGTIGRPHVARALVEAGAVEDIAEAFDRYLGRGRPAFVAKVLPSTEEVCAVVHGGGGVLSAAHLRDRASRGTLKRLAAAGVDAVEARHPSHDPDMAGRIERLAAEVGMVVTGGSDWHGDSRLAASRGVLGSQQVPAAWLERLEDRQRSLNASEVGT